MSTKHTRIAIIDKERCKPQKCNFECGLICPQNRQKKECIVLADIEDVGNSSKTAIISKSKKIAQINESICIGCGLCAKPPQNRGCPFGAVLIVNIPTEINGDIIMRYNANGFRLYRMPILKQGKVLGFIGQNGIGKSTIVNILSDKIKPNFEKFDTILSNSDIINKFKGTEMHKYMTKLYSGELAISIKPQHVDSLVHHLKSKKVDPSIKQYIQNKCKVDFNNPSQWITRVITTLELDKIINLKVCTLSGGELQRLVCATTFLTEANVYIFDEPTNYLDVRQRLNVAELIRELMDEHKYIAVIEHDLAILDYISDYICILYGKPSAYGVVSRPLSTSHGINEYFDGFISAENMRFRANEYDLRSLDVVEGEKILFSDTRIQYTENIIIYPSFELTIEAGDFPMEGSMTIIMGKNGTGKSTFINHIAKEMQSTISVKPQYLSVEQFAYPNGTYPTVGEFLMNNIRTSYINDLFRSDVVKPMMINTIEDRLLNELSGGEMQRFWIVYCLGQEAHIYLIDEPSACLDIEQRVTTTKMFKKFFMHNKKVGFIVEHDMMMAVSLGSEQNSQAVIVEQIVEQVSNDVIRKSLAKTPVEFKEGINDFLKSLNVTFHTGTFSRHKRPRINKPNSQKDKEQKQQNKYYD
jgi:ATP-binding cassette subfamily E protein 1